MTLPSEDDVFRWFSTHKPNEAEAKRHGQVRESGEMFANVIANLCPDAHETEVAIEKVREAVYWANASIACNKE